MENRQGLCWLPSNIYVHTDKKGFKRLYVLSLAQRVFMFFEDPKFCILGSYFVTFMLLIITFNLFTFIASTLPAVNYSPTDCLNPACDHGPLCPNTKVCEPVAKEWTAVVEFSCVIVFTVEYGIRMLIVWTVPPRLSNTLKKAKKSNEHHMNSLFTTNEPSVKDELFAHVKLALSESELDSEMLIRTERNTSIIAYPSLNTMALERKRSFADRVTKLEKTDELDSSDNDSGSLDNIADKISVGELRRMDEHADGSNFDDGFALPNMNQPVQQAEYSSLTDQPRSEINRHRGSIYDNDFLAKRYSVKNKFNYQTHDDLVRLDQKSRGMDKSHRYSGMYKTNAYFWKMLNIIDLLSILPFYAEKFVDSNNSTSLSIIRILRLARVFRIFKIGKGNAGVQMLGKTVYVSMPALSLLAFFIVLGVILIGALIFFIEGGEFTVSPEFPTGAFVISGFFGETVRTAYTSIIASIYWAVVVTTTTGYGDMVPMSFFGKLIAIAGAYYGVLLLALPITVIGNNFDKILNAQQGRDNEQFIYECLVGITRSLDLEYRARARLAPPPSSAYKMTMVTAVISTFDSTKQTLLKDAIMEANRAQARKRRAEEASKKQDSAHIKKQSLAAETVRGRSLAAEAGQNSELNEEEKQNIDTQFEDNLTVESSEGDDVYAWLGEPEEIVALAADVEVACSSTAAAPTGHKAPRRASYEVNPLKPLEQPKMAGITWSRMPKMPDKTHLNHYAGGRNPESGMTAAEELEHASRDLSSAIADWRALFT